TRITKKPRSIKKKIAKMSVAKSDIAVELSVVQFSCAGDFHAIKVCRRDAQFHGLTSFTLMKLGLSSHEITFNLSLRKVCLTSAFCVVKPQVASDVKTLKKSEAVVE